MKLYKMWVENILQTKFSTTEWNDLHWTGCLHCYGLCQSQPFGQSATRSAKELPKGLGRCLQGCPGFLSWADATPLVFPRSMDKLSGFGADKLKDFRSRMLPF